jgi:hypothetical protein
MGATRYLERSATTRSVHCANLDEVTQWRSAAPAEVLDGKQTVTQLTMKMRRGVNRRYGGRSDADMLLGYGSDVLKPLKGSRTLHTFSLPSQDCPIIACHT